MIQRYDVGTRFSDSSFSDTAIDLVVTETGRAVLYSDHLAEMQRLEAENSVLKAQVQRLSAPVSEVKP